MARDRLEVTVSAAVSPGALSDFAPTLKAAARAGDWVCVEPAGQRSLCVTAADSLGDEELQDHEREGGPAFIHAWNAASPLGG
ncbi:hypothetical protein JD276_05390 [Leucobacter sp. CSA1]|uniref:Uncharacterized protein n=1 Tax=Leucobacter chromiisoli TaxID=2796471 RepID=A0A934Q7W4_9MICO|nr:hypothetical protein [Leucobacter chromiisoli]MBK0418467.1 hypothetical protein [Leucobacter chromiisoli]